MRKLKRFFLILMSITVVNSALMFYCSCDSKWGEKKSVPSYELRLKKEEESAPSYEFRSDPSHKIELRHYLDQSRQDSLYIFQEGKLIYAFICKEIDSEFGPFADSVLLKVSNINSHVGIERINLLMVDSILYIPITMSSNGGFYLMVYDITTKREIGYKDDDIWARGSVFVAPEKQEILVCKGQNVSKLEFELLYLKNKEFVFKKKYSMDEHDEDIERFLGKTVKW